MRDSDPRHPRCKRVDTTTEPLADSALASTPSTACTNACTSEPENANAPAADQKNEGEGIDQVDPLTALAAALLTLSPADWAKLAAMLTGR
jgi:hypothetical protein